MKLNSPINGIFFDIGWTLLRPASGDWYVLEKMEEFAAPGSLAAIPPNKKAAAMAKAGKYLDDNHLLATVEEEVRQFEVFYSMLAESLPELGLTGERSRALARSRAYDMDNYVFFDDALATLGRLRGKYRLGVISDTWPSVERILESAGIGGYFCSKTYSCNLGVFKPDERMYLDALRQMGLPPEQTVFVDDMERNLDGAAKLGIQGVHIVANPEAVGGGKYPRIRRISELLDMLSE